MEELLSKLGIDSTSGIEQILSELEEKQIEYLDRLDIVEDTKRKKKLKADLEQIEMAISSFSWMIKRTTTNTVSNQKELQQGENFEELKSRQSSVKMKELKSVSVKKETQQPVVQDSQKTAEERYDEALAMLATPNYMEGVEALKKMGNEEYIPAIIKLAQMYEEGNRMPKDMVCAVKWYEKAAKFGDMEAQNTLGYFYYQGIGVLKNHTESIKWYEKAALQGHCVL